MPNFGIKQPVVCGIMSQDSTFTGLLALESFGNQIRILNLDFHRQFISGFLSEQAGRCHFQECVPLSGESYLGRMPGGFRFGQITSQGIQMF